MKDKWMMAFIGLLVSLFLGWAGWVSLTLIQRGEVIINVDTRLTSVEDQLHTQVPVLFKKVDILEADKADKDHDH